jgi:hypothetical protein
MVDKIDTEYFKEVMAHCRKECSEIAGYDYLVWVNSMDYILREQGIDVGYEKGNECYKKAKQEFEKTIYIFEVLPSLEPEPETVETLASFFFSVVLI